LPHLLVISETVYNIEAAYSMDDVDQQVTCAIKRAKLMGSLPFHLEVSTPVAAAYDTIQMICTLEISGASKYPPEKI
jgi:hypothetical protein